MLVFLMYFLFNGTLMACMKPAIGGPSLSPWTEVIFQQCEMRLEDRKRFFFCLFVCLFVCFDDYAFSLQVLSFNDWDFERRNSLAYS